MSTSYEDMVQVDEKKLLAFIQDLKEAIQSGQLKCGAVPNHETSTRDHIKNVNNLSNQTFSYIINWLKQQQHICLSESGEKVIISLLKIFLRI